MVTLKSVCVIHVLPAAVSYPSSELHPSRRCQLAGGGSGGHFSVREISSCCPGLLFLPINKSYNGGGCTLSKRGEQEYERGFCVRPPLPVS